MKQNESPRTEREVVLATTRERKSNRSNHLSDHYHYLPGPCLPSNRSQEDPDSFSHHQIYTRVYAKTLRKCCQAPLSSGNSQLHSFQSLEAYCGLENVMTTSTGFMIFRFKTEAELQAVLEKVYGCLEAKLSFCNNDIPTTVK